MSLIEWQYPVNTSHISEFCASLERLPTFISSTIAEWQSKFVRKVVGLTDTEKLNRENQPFYCMRNILASCQGYQLPSFFCKWNYFMVYITKNVSAEEYLLFIDPNDKYSVSMDQPLALILEFFKMTQEDNKTKNKFKYILKNQIRHPEKNNNGK